MQSFIVGDPAVLLSNGTRQTVTAINGHSITCSGPGGDSNTYTDTLLGYLGSQVQVKGVRVDNSAVVNPYLQPTDFFVEFTNATQTGFVTRSLVPAGTVLFVRNTTGANFTTGDFNVPNNHTWEFVFDGTAWSQVVAS